MPAKKSTKPKSRVSSKSKKVGFKFHWWMALLLVLIVGGVGFIVFRQSFAYRDCGTTPTGAICDNGPVKLKIVGNVNNLRQCGIAQAEGPGSQRCGVFNNGQFSSPFYYVYGANNDDSQAIYKMKNNFNNTCGRISMNNPFDYFKNRTLPNYRSPNNIWYGSTYSDQYVWWTSVGCPYGQYR